MSKGWFDKDGHLTDAGIIASANAWQKGDVLDEALRAHLESCVECQERLLDYRLFLDEIGEDEVKISPYQLVKEGGGKSGLAVYWRIAAVLLLIAAFAWLFTRSGALSEQQIAAKVTVLREGGSLAFWDAQVESDQVLRGGAVEVIEPAIDTVLLASEVTFALSEPSKRELKLELFTKASEITPTVYAFEEGATQLMIEALEEGLYYWRLFERGRERRWRSILVGRFYLINNQNR